MTDIYTIIAAKLFNAAPDEVTIEKRSTAMSIALFLAWGRRLADIAPVYGIAADDADAVEQHVLGLLRERAATERDNTPRTVV